jgi:hypothetical protein
MKSEYHPNFAMSHRFESAFSLLLFVKYLQRSNLLLAHKKATLVKVASGREREKAGA